MVDVGIHRRPQDVVSGSEAMSKLCGDFRFEDVESIASAITPVPGGVGPMTIACLLKNTVDAAFWQQ